MIRRLSVRILFCFFAALATPQTNFTHQQYEADFDYLWQNISEDYAYFDQKQTDWNKVREIYRPQLSSVTTRDGFVALLESVLEELYDFHTHLNTNTAASPRIVPSGVRNLVPEGSFIASAGVGTVGIAARPPEPRSS